MSKQLSNTLLSLRFMQNAQRAKQEAQVEAEQAKIKDEAEWSVPQSWKDAWGIGSTSAASSSTVTHEASYVPFLFSSSADDLGQPSSQASSSRMPKLKGRRTFNARGQEVIPEPAKSEAEPGEIEEVNMVEGAQPRGRLSQISGFQKPSKKEGKDRDMGRRKPQVKTIPTFQPPISPKKSKEPKRVKTAQMLIREDNGKGLRAPPPLQTFDGSADIKMDVDSSAGFLRPAGVDAPAGESKPPSKRGREPTERHSKEERWPRKKKKKTGTS